MNNKQDKREILGIQATIVDEAKAGRPSVQTRQIYADGVAVDRKMGEDGLFVRVSELPLKLMGIIETLVDDAVDKLDEAPAIISYAEGRNRYFTLNGRHYCTAFLDEGNRFESPFDKELRKLMSVLYLFKETFGGVSLNEIDYDPREDALSPESELVLSLGRAAFEGKDWSKMSYRSIVHLAYEVASATSGWMIPDSDSAETGDPEGELYALASKAISDSLLENPSKTDMERDQDVLSGIFIGKGHAPYGVAALWASPRLRNGFLEREIEGRDQPARGSPALEAKGPHRKTGRPLEGRERLPRGLLQGLGLPQFQEAPKAMRVRPDRQGHLPPSSPTSSTGGCSPPSGLREKPKINRKKID
jgi:hypothetical protein